MRLKTRVVTSYIKNEKKRTITCVMTVHNEVPHRLQKYGLQYAEDPYYYEFQPDLRIYVGVAKCNPQDEWDERYGRHLAEYRAMIKRYNDVNREIRNYIWKTSEKLDKLYEYGMIKRPKEP